MEMNIKVEMDLSGLDISGLEDDLKKVTEIAARNVETRAKQIVPVDTGATKNSIFVSPGKPSFEQRVGPTTEYAPFIEFGTRHWSGKAFMIPSLEAERKNFLDALGQVFKKMG